MKTLIQHYAEKEDEKVEMENKSIRREIERLKKKALRVHGEVGMGEGIERLGGYIQIEEYEEKGERYG